MTTSRPRGGASNGAPKQGGLPATPTPRRTRGSGVPPRSPGGSQHEKESKRRRPDARSRRQARRQLDADAAAAGAAPYSTLLAALTTWAAMRAAYWVLRTIQCGFRVPWASRPLPTKSKGYPMPEDVRLWAETEVGRWVAAGYASKLSPEAGAGAPWVSPTFVVHGSKPRLVIDLRLINLHIRKRIFQYQKLPSFLATLVPDDHLVSWDVSDAFYHVRLRPSDRKFFRFVVGGVVYEPRVLPFGMRLSPWLRTKLLRPVVAALRLRGFQINAYVDDFAATGRGDRPSFMAAATAARVEILSLFEQLGIQVHPAKGVTVGTTHLPLLGYLVDTARRIVVLPPTRLQMLVGGAKALISISRSHVSSKVLQRFSGLAVSCHLAIPSARFFLRRLYDCQSRTRPTSKLSHGAVADLSWFSRLIKEPGVGRARWPKTLGELTTDASPYGWGGHWQHLLPAAGFFTVAQRNLHINVKKVAAVRFCLLAFGAQLLGEEGLLRLRVDSRVAMHVINGFSSRSPALMGELRKLHAVAKQYRVTLRASWLPSVANVSADALSRQSDRNDWRISDEAFAALQQRYGPYTVDRFATPLNARCPRFNTKTHAPGTEAVDAFSVGWGGGGENNWVYPPFNLAELVVDKIRADRATATVILPVWGAQQWWAPTVAAANEAFLLARTASLFTLGHGRRPPKPPRWRVAVFRFVRGGLPPPAISAQRARLASADRRRCRFNGRRGRTSGAVNSAGCWRMPRPDAALMPLPPAGSA